MTVFTIEMLPQNRTLYKLCGRYNNTNRARQPKEIARTMFVTDTENTLRTAEDDSDDLIVDIQCDSQDAVGHYIFVRDDRKHKDYFSICDVEVFQFDKKGQCSEIIVPLYSQINLPYTMLEGQTFQVDYLISLLYDLTLKRISKRQSRPF